MARNGIAQLSTTRAVALTSGSSTTSQGPTQKKITTGRTKPAPPMAERMGHLRERGRETKVGLSEFAIWESAHAIPARRSGQSEAPGPVAFPTSTQATAALLVDNAASRGPGLERRRPSRRELLRFSVSLSSAASLAMAVWEVRSSCEV